MYYIYIIFLFNPFKNTWLNWKEVYLDHSFHWPMGTNNYKKDSSTSAYSRW